MTKQTLHFSVKAYAAWAPGVTTPAAWQTWANHDLTITTHAELSLTELPLAELPLAEPPFAEPSLSAMPSLLRRRALMPGKMALEVAYDVLGNSERNIPTVFCSRHGECAHAISLLTDLQQGIGLSPTAFSLSVHNAPGGLLAIARQDHTQQFALAAGQSTIEHAVIEACGLLADGEASVLLVAYDNALPSVLQEFQDTCEEPYAWAWLIEPPTTDIITLSWSAPDPSEPDSSASDNDNIDPNESAGLQILRFFLTPQARLKRCVNGQQWQWTH